MADANLSGNENHGINNEPANNKLTKLTIQFTVHYKYASLSITIILKTILKINVFVNLTY